MNKTGNILFCGVGGQGILLAGEITSAALLSAGFDIKNSEVHGMAQRGGSVVAHMRFGRKVYSPLIEPGAADFEVAFEEMEALRYVRYLNPNSKVIVNMQKIPPPGVATGLEKYPEDILQQLQARCRAVFPIRAFDIAKEAGETRSVNLVLVGALSALLPVNESAFIEAIEKRVPERFRKANLRAFMKGRQFIKIQEDKKRP